MDDQLVLPGECEHCGATIGNPIDRFCCLECQQEWANEVGDQDLMDAEEVVT